MCAQNHDSAAIIKSHVVIVLDVIEETFTVTIKLVARNATNETLACHVVALVLLLVTQCPKGVDDDTKHHALQQDNDHNCEE